MAKKIWTAVATMCVGVLASIQVAAAHEISEREVPAAVKSSLEQHWPKANVYEWKYDRDDREYEADFRVGALRGEANWDEAGQLLKSKIDVEPQDIPKAVVDAVMRDYPGAQILGANYRTRGTRSYYDVGVRVDGYHKNRRYTPDGHAY